MSTVCISKIPRNKIKLYYWDYYDVWTNYVTNYDVYTYTHKAYWFYEVWTYMSMDEETSGWYLTDIVERAESQPSESDETTEYRNVFNTWELEITPTGESGQTIDDLVEYNGEIFYANWGGQNVTAGWDTKDDFYSGDPNSDTDGIMWRRTKIEVINKPAEYPLGIVASESPNAYPDNAEKGAYWYIKRG
jgi:hypothetical protein